MNMDVLAALTARHTLEKEAALPALIAPVLAAGAKALPYLATAGRAALSLGSKAAPLAKTVGSKSLELGKSSLPYLGMGAAMEGGSAGIRALSGGGGEAPPQGPSGPRGPGATHGMLGFPQQDGPKGPPDFGDRHSRDRADPDTDNGGSQSSGTGFKLASAADYAAFISFRKQAFGLSDVGHAADVGVDVAGRTAGKGLQYAGKGVELAGKGVSSAGKGLRRAGGFVGANPRKSLAGAAALAAAYPIGKALFGKKDEEKQSADIGGFADRLGEGLGSTVQRIGNTIMPESALEAGGNEVYRRGMDVVHRASNRAVARGGDPIAAAMAQGSMMDRFATERGRNLLKGRALQGQNEAIGAMSGLDKVKGRVGQGVGAAGRFMVKHPRSAAGAAAVAVPLAAYGMYRGGKALFGGGGSAEEKTSAMLLGNNLIDVMAFTMERAEKEAGLRRPFEQALTVKRAAGGYSFSPMGPDEFQKTQQPRQLQSHPDHPDWVFDPQQHDWVHKDSLGSGATNLLHRRKPWEGGTSLSSLLKDRTPGGSGTAVPKPAPATPTAPVVPPDQGPPAVGKGPGNGQPPQPPGPPGAAKPSPGAPAAPPAPGGAPGAAQTPSGDLPGYDEPPGTPPAAAGKPPANYMQGYDELPGTTTTPPAGGAPPPAGGVQVGAAATPGHGAGATPPTPAPSALPKPTIKPTGGFNVGGDGGGGKKQIPMGV